MHPGPAQAAGLADLPSCPTSGQACVAVKVVRDGQQVGALTYTSTADLAGSGADVIDQDYAVPGSSSVPVSSGTSVARLIAGAGVDPADVHFAEVDGTDGYGRHVLTSGELQSPSPGHQAPVLYPNPEGNANDYVNFVRPARGGADDQLQGGPDLGFLQSDQDAALEVVVHLSGGPLDVTATATAVPGSNDRSFTLSSDPGGGNLLTTWVYPDGSTSTQASPTYTFPAGSQGGTYPVSVAVEDRSDGSFGWGTTQVQLGAAAAPSAGPTASAGSGGHGHGHQGSTHGHHSGSPHPTSGHGGGGSATATPTAHPTTSAGTGPSGPPTLPPSPQPSLPTALYSPTEQPAAPSSTPSATPPPTSTPTPAAQGEEVTGILLTSADEEPPSSDGQILDVPSPSASAAPALDPPFRVATWLWLTIGGLLLLVAGAASESTWARRRVRRLLGPLLGRWSRIGV